MICEKCKNEKLTSKIYEGCGTTTLMGYSPYYDELGKYHSHNPNKRKYNYHCSKGHHWTLKFNDQCSSCNYGKHSRIITYHE